ncbi:uncharacterized protein LOC120081084 [Benincasa hispida]|uniref:uncharacterized protein LOC120081084 n=1 Tax=Benincasa hispida TaxID=102211 RepID=UPI001901868C|nr:uncharacterized protein LOC120081084 [Benincasa hispida]
MGFSSVGNGASSSSFSNLSHLAPPFTLDRSVTRPFSSPLVDMTEPSFGVGAGVPLNSTLHNWLPSTTKTSGLDFFSSSTPEFDWLSFATGSKYPRLQPMMEPSDKHEPLLGSLTVSSTDPSVSGESSAGLTTSIGKEKPYYPSYASTSCNKAVPVVIFDQPTYDWPSNSHVVTFSVPPCTNFSHGSSGFERSVEESSHSTDMLDLNRCNEFVRECPSEELLLKQNLNIEQANDLRISDMDAHSAFPGCHPKTRTPPSNPASRFHNFQYLRKAPYQEILREQDARLSVTTSIVNPPNTNFSIRPPVLDTDSFVCNIGPCHMSGNGDQSFEAKQGGDDLSNLKKFLPVNSDSQEFFRTENHGTCLDKHDPIVTEFSSIKTHDLRNNIHYAEDSPDHTLKAGMGLHVPDSSPQFSLDLKTKIATTIESSSENFDQYNLAAVDSPCWKGAPICRVSPFQAFETSTPSSVKMVEVNNDVNLSLSQVLPSSAENTVEVFVHEPSESTIGSVVEKGATSTTQMPSIAGSSLLATQKTSNSVKAGEFYSKMGGFHPTTGCIHEPGEDVGGSYSSCSMPQSKYKNNLMSGKKIAPTSYMKKHADAELNCDDSFENGLNHLPYDVAKHVQNLPFELVKLFLGESISKIDIRILVDTLHSLSELLLVCHLNGLAALHQKDVKSLEAVINNLDVCLKSVGSQGSLSPEQRTSQNLEQFHQLHLDVGVLKSQLQMTKIEGGNLECLSNDGNDVDKKNQYMLSVKKDREAADSLYLRNRIDSVKEDSMTKALKKAMSENFHDDEEHPQTLLYKNLWLEAEAALCANNLRARLNSARSEMEKHESPKVRENVKNLDEALISDASPGSNTIGTLASKTKVGSTSFVSFQTSPAVSVTSHAADDVITRFHILKCREDVVRHRDVGNLVTLSDFEVLGKKDVAEKSALDKKQTAVPYIKDMDSSFPTSKVKGNDSAPAVPSISPTLTRSSHVDDVMSRFQILKSRGERLSSLDTGKVQKITNSGCNEIDMLAHEGDTMHGLGISTMHHPIADDKNEVDNLDASVLARQDVLRRRGNNISLTPAGEEILEVEVEHLYPASKRVYWPVGENKVKKGGGLGVEMEPFLGFEAGNGSRSHVEGKVPAGCSDGSLSADWEHVLWRE